MQRKVVYLYGAGSIGKTQTIRMVRDLIVQTHTVMRTTIRPRIRATTFDISVVIEITIEGQIVKVGIESQGDPSVGRPINSFDYFLGVNCDIIICVANIKSLALINKINNSGNRGYQIIRIDQNIDKNPATQESTNLRKAQEIISEAGL